MLYMSEFGIRLELALRLAGRTRRELAQHLGITPQAVGHAIRCGIFNAPNTVRAARYLRCDVFWLATGEGNPSMSTGVILSDEERSVLSRVLADAGGPVEETPRRRKGDNPDKFRQH